MIEIVNCSTELNAFLSFLRTCEESNRLAILTENDMDCQTQDILHNIELNENSQYDYICQGFALRDIRRKRRKAKDIKEATAPICNWMKENRKVMGVKDALAEKTGNKGEVKLTKSMSIADMIKAMKPEIEKALPKVITPERFTRMALSALNTTPKLQECSQMSFLGALMNAAQLGLEPNTPLGQAYLIPYKNHGKLECQFQIGYKGLIDMVYRNDNIQTVQAQCVYEKDVFEYELGLEPKLVHKPAIKDRGELILVYALWKAKNGGYGFEVMSKEDIDNHARRFSQSFSSGFSPWKTNYEEMAKKTVIKKCLKYAPLKSDFVMQLSNDESVKTELSVDMSEVANEQEPIDADYQEVSQEAPDGTETAEAVNNQGTAE